MPLIAAWNFEQAGQSAFTDISGNNHDLTPGSNAGSVFGHNSDYAVQSADGPNTDVGAAAYGTYPGGSPLTGSVTCMCWVKVTDMSDGTPCICVWNSSGRTDPINIYIESDGSASAWWFDSNETVNDGPTSTISGLVTTGAWAHVAGVFVPGSGVTLYVNGVTATTYSWQPSTNAFYSTWETLLIGSSRWGSNGIIIDDVRLYNEALSGAQISSLMNDTVGGMTPVSWLRIGSHTVQNLYLGATQIHRAYLGNALL